jgi:hypothetical protein
MTDYEHGGQSAARPGPRGGAKQFVPTQEDIAVSLEINASHVSIQRRVDTRKPAGSGDRR